MCVGVGMCVCVCPVPEVDEGSRLFLIWPVGEPIPAGEKLKQSQLAESRSASLTGQMCSQRDVAACVCVCVCVLCLFVRASIPPRI